MHAAAPPCMHKAVQAHAAASPATRPACTCCSYPCMHNALHAYAASPPASTLQLQIVYYGEKGNDHTKRQPAILGFWGFRALGYALHAHAAASPASSRQRHDRISFHSKVSYYVFYILILKTLPLFLASYDPPLPSTGG